MSLAAHFTVKDLLQLCIELKEGIIKQQIHRNRCKGVEWQTVKVKGIIYIMYDTVPTDFKAKYELPLTYAEARQQIDTAQRAKERRVRVEKDEHRERAAFVYQGMQQAADREFMPYFNEINQRFPGTKTEKVRDYAKRAAVFAWIKKHYRANTAQELQIFFNCYSKVIANKYHEDKDPVKSFQTWVIARVQESTDMVEIAYNRRSFVKVQKRTPEYVLHELSKMFVSGMYGGGTEAHKHLLSDLSGLGLKCPGVSTIKSLWKEMEYTPNLALVRFGKAYVNRRFTPYLSFEKAAHRNDQWQIDGKVVPFFTRGEDGSGERWTVFIVIDNHSRKIVGYSVARRETTEMILAALEDAVANTGRWPGEVLSDQHAFHKTTNARLLREYVESMGCHIKPSTEAQFKPIVERYNQYLDSLWRKYPHWLGKGVKSKNPNDRPSDEMLKEAWKPANYKTEAELRAIVLSSIIDFNNMELTALAGKTPNTAYEASTDHLSIAISEYDRPRLFRPVSQYLVDRGQINIHVGIKKYEYQLQRGSDLMNRYNGKHLEVRYEDLSQGIYIYDPETGEALGEVPLKRKDSSVHALQTDADRKAAMKIEGIKNGMHTRPKRKQKQVEEQTMRNHPEEAAKLNGLHVPKDVAAELLEPEKKRKAAIEGVSRDMVPQRRETVPVYAEKTAASPFQMPSTITQKWQWPETDNDY